MFITAMAANPLAVELARQQGIAIAWGTWAIAALAPGVVSLVLVPLLIYRLCPPGIRESPDAQAIAHAELVRMGPMQRAERILLGILVVLLALWIFGPMIGVDATAAALAGLGLLLLSGVLVWDDVCREHEAWNTLVWFASLVMMATFLGQLGFIGWFSKEVSGAIGETGWVTGFLVLSLVYFYSHYLFASNTAHVSAMFAPFLTVAVALGAPPLLAALVLGFFSNLFACLTHYATGPSPIFFGSGYVSLGAWWTVGAIVSVVNIIIWLGIGGAWWKLLGLW
jgi:DASS family divalent anion:Na+ symporter